MAHDSSCRHLKATKKRTPVKPSAQGCSECLASGGEWMHLRLCLSCGHVGCCDNSPNRHATKHHQATKHPVIRSYEPEEAWAFCFVDDIFVEELPAFEGESAKEHYWPR
jgi:uncharacterized UBP type Zn finger protein